MGVSQSAQDRVARTTEDDRAMASRQTAGKLKSPSRPQAWNAYRKHRSQMLQADAYDLGASEELLPVRNKTIDYQATPIFSPTRKHAKMSKQLEGKSVGHAFPLLDATARSRSTPRPSSRDEGGPGSEAIADAEQANNAISEVVKRPRGRPRKSSTGFTQHRNSAVTDAFPSLDTTVQPIDSPRPSPRHRQEIGPVAISNVDQANAIPQAVKRPRGRPRKSSAGPTQRRTLDGPDSDNQATKATKAGLQSGLDGNDDENFAGGSNSTRIGTLRKPTVTAGPGDEETSPSREGNRRESAALNHAVTFDSNGNHENDGTESTPLDNNFVVKKIRPSELRFPDAEGDVQQVSETSQRRASTTRPAPLRLEKKRKAAKTGGRPAKAQKTSDGFEMPDRANDTLATGHNVDEESSRELEVQEVDESFRASSELADQWNLLRDIYAKCHSLATEINKDYPEERSLPQARYGRDKRATALATFIQRCDAKLQKLKDKPETRQNLSTEIKLIDDKLALLHVGIDPGNRQRGDAMIAWIFPMLVRLLKNMVQQYEALDEGDHLKDSPVSFEHLRDVESLISTARSAGEVGFEYPRSKRLTKLKVHGRMRLKVLRPLGHVGKVIGEHISQHDAQQAAQRAEARAQYEREAATIQAEEATRQAEEKHFKSIIREWKQLHDQRRDVLRDCYLNLHQQKHFEYIEPERLERDLNGVQYERVQVFVERHRDFPSPAFPSAEQIQSARSRPWTPAQRDALREGLEQFAGEDLFRKVFRKYCRKREILFEFNVTEIVVKAADLKDLWVKRCLQAGRRVPQWIQMIPTWTRPQALGKENERGHHEDLEEIDER